MASVKGILLSAMNAFLKQSYGPESVDAAMKALPPEENALLQKRFLDGSMYPYETMVALRHLMRQLATNQPTPASDPASDLGAFLAESVFTGAFRPLLAKDPATMIGKIPWVKNFFYDDYDQVEAAMTGESSCRVVYRYVKGVRPSRGGCRSLGSFWARTLELAGASRVAMTHPACICEGADRCEFALTW